MTKRSSSSGTTATITTTTTDEGGVPVRCTVTERPCRFNVMRASYERSAWLVHALEGRAVRAGMGSDREVVRILGWPTRVVLARAPSSTPMFSEVPPAPPSEAGARRGRGLRPKGVTWAWGVATHILPELAHASAGPSTGTSSNEMSAEAALTTTS